MAKDPAILWYWNDWQGGTMTMSRHQKGCYMDLLAAQFNSGPLSLEQVKTVLGTDQAIWTVLSAKFKKKVENGNELFFNERMESEKIRRRAFSEKQSLNGKKGGRKAKLNPTLNPKESNKENEIEDENATETLERGAGENLVGLSGEGFFADSLPKEIELTEIQVGATVQYIRLKSKKVIDTREVVDQWEAFKIQQFGLHNWYNNFEKLLTHFRDSLKIEYERNGTRKQVFTDGNKRNGSSKNAGAKQFLDELRPAESNERS